MKRRNFLIMTALLIGLAFLISQVVVNWYKNPGNSDFFTFWLSGRLITEGLDPYSVADWLHGHETYNSTWIVNQAFVYPLPLAVILAPLGVLELKTAFSVWVSLTVIALYFSITLLLHYFGTSKLYYVIPVIAGVVVFRPLNSLLLNGQITGFLLLIIILAVSLMEKNHWFWGGFVLTLTLLKPHLGGIMIILASLYFFRQKKYTALNGVVTCSLALFLIGLIANPNWVSQYLSILFNKYNQIFGFAPTVWGLAFYITRFNNLPALIIGAISSFLLIAMYLALILRWKSISPAEATALAITVMLLATPSIWPYDQILLLFPIVQTMVMMKKLQVKYLGISLFFIGVSIVSYILYGITIRIEMENLNAILSMIVLVSFLTALWITNKTLSTDLFKEVIDNG